MYSLYVAQFSSKGEDDPLMSATMQTSGALVAVFSQNTSEVNGVPDGVEEGFQ